MSDMDREFLHRMVVERENGIEIAARALRRWEKYGAVAPWICKLANRIAAKTARIVGRRTT